MLLHCVPQLSEARDQILNHGPLNKNSLVFFICFFPDHDHELQRENRQLKRDGGPQTVEIGRCKRQRLDNEEEVCIDTISTFWMPFSCGE